MTDDTTAAAHAESAEETMRQALSYGNYGEDAGAIVSMIAAQTHATLAVAAQLGRIADWLGGVQLVDPMSVLEDDAEEVDDVAVCVSCGHPITRRAGTTFWGHDDARRNKSLGGGHDAAPIPESMSV